jgi:hypothetical protein
MQRQILDDIEYFIVARHTPISFIFRPPQAGALRLSFAHHNADHLNTLVAGTRIEAWLFQIQRCIQSLKKPLCGQSATTMRVSFPGDIIARSVNFVPINAY